MQTAVAASEARANGPRWRRWPQTALLAAPALGLAALGWQHRFITDDGFIFFRVVEQITAGHGPVFNRGQRVEAFTSPLWLAVLTVLDVATPFRLEWIAVACGVALTGVGLGLSCFGAAKLVCDPVRRDVLVPVGALVPLVIAPMWYFATSGLETGLAFGWIGASMWILAGWARRDDGVRTWEALVLGIGWLVRPDLLPLSIAFAGALLLASWSTDGWRDRGRVVAVMFALPFLYQVFRMGYYGALVPNTAIAKEATLSRWDAGWRYVSDLGGTYWLWIPILALVVGSYAPLVMRFHRSGATRRLAVVVAFLVGAALQALYIVKVGGDYFPARLLLPAVFAFCAPVAVAPWRREFAVVFAVVPWALICAATLRPSFGFSGVTSRPITVEARHWGPGGAARAWFSGPGVYYSLHRIDVEPRRGLHLPTAAFRGIGLPSFAIGPELDVLDLLGLADPITARLRIQERGVVGHEKQLPGPWAAARLTARGSRLRAEDFPPGPLVVSMIPLTDGAAFAKQVAWARAALRCPDLEELRTSYSSPMSIGRFVANLAYSFDSTRLRFPADPEKAYRELCGPGRPPGT